MTQQNRALRTAGDDDMAYGGVTRLLADVAEDRAIDDVQHCLGMVLVPGGRVYLDLRQADACERADGCLLREQPAGHLSLQNRT